MIFEQAINEIKNGAFYCRESWTLEDGYLVLMPGMTHVWKIVLKPTPNAGNYIFSLDDLLASDWKEFEIPAEPIEA